MNFAKKITAALMCLALIIGCFSACGKPEDSTEALAQTDPAAVETAIDTISYTLPYLRTDSLNPYKCVEETNRNLCTLLYDSLFSVNNSFKAVGVIAESYTTGTKSITVTIKSGISFTDGTAITADDIIYSYNLAKKSEYYSDYLKNISTAYKDDSGKIVFTLKSANPYEVANLTFPIIKNGSDNVGSSSDDYSAALPVGSGRYILKEANDVKSLTANKSRLGSYQPKYNNIGLKDITDVSSLPTLFSLGEIDFYTESFSQGEYKRYTGAGAAYETTNFTYLGINSQCYVLNESKVRRAIALLINRTDLASVSFSGFATATSTPFHPSFYGLDSCTLPPMKFDQASAIELLNEAGFHSISEDGVRYSEQKGRLSISLLVNKENSFKLAMARSIQQALAEADITVRLKEYTYSEYVQAVEEGAYDLYIGEAKLLNNFDLTAFFSEDGGLSYGIDPECKSAADYAKLESGEIKMQSFLDTFADDLPFIPLAYRKGLTVRSNKMTTASKTIVSDYYFNINEWTVG